MKNIEKWLLQILALLISPLLISSTPLPSSLPSIVLNQRQHCDLEMIMDGSFAPIESFLNKQDYECVLENMRLKNGKLWPIPVVLDISQKQLEKIQMGSQVALKDQEGFILALLEVEEMWEPNKAYEAEKIYGTCDPSHPGVNHLFNQTGNVYISGRLTKLQAPIHFDFVDLRNSPSELKQQFEKKGIEKIVAFQTRNPMYRAQFEMTLRAIEQSGAHLLIHPAIGMTQPGDIDYFTRVKCYKKMLKHYPEGSTTLSLLPLAMRMAGPREALWHAIIRKNYGCTHFIIGCDHANPIDSTGKSFYTPYAAQELVTKYADELEINILPFKEFVYSPSEKCQLPIDEIDFERAFMTYSEAEIRQLLNEGAEIPEWYSFPEVSEELRKKYPPRSKQGFTLFFTGLSGSGKSTLAKGLEAKLAEVQDRPITMLDGDIIRNHLSSELGFSKEHRSLNVRRVGYVASEITKNGGIAICPMIAPYEIDRNYNRDLIKVHGNFVEIYVSTSFDVCASRDTKGLYNLAKEGKIKGFTGLDDPYEIPQRAEVVIDTTKFSIAEGVELILNYLQEIGHINK